MPAEENAKDWMGDLQWQGYPRLWPVRDSSAIPEPVDALKPRKALEVRAEALARENESLRLKAETLAGLVSEFELRFSEAAQAYESAALESESARRNAELENARLAGELQSVRAELARRDARDHSRETDLGLERERRLDLEKSLLEARRRLTDLEADLLAARGKGAELAGGMTELRRQADASNERAFQAKALTDQDVQLLRQEMREFLAKFHRIQDTLGDAPPGDSK